MAAPITPVDVNNQPLAAPSITSTVGASMIL